MKRVLMVLPIVLGMVATVSAQDAVDVKGTWNLTLESPQGAFPMGLKFEEVTADKISGTLEGPQGALNITGKLDGNAISFTAVFEGNGRSITLTFTGKVEENKMSGTADFGGMGSGNWSAEKAK